MRSSARDRAAGSSNGFAFADAGGDDDAGRGSQRHCRRDTKPNCVDAVADADRHSHRDRDTSANILGGTDAISVTDAGRHLAANAGAVPVANSVPDANTKSVAVTHSVADADTNSVADADTNADTNAGAVDRFADVATGLGRRCGG